jgi:hypothetical protein
MARILLLVLLLAMSAVNAFTNHGAVVGHRRGTGGVDIIVLSKKSGPVPAATAATRCNTSRLYERRWNFNEGQSPWGLKRNAEIWNGRVAQVRCMAMTCLPQRYGLLLVNGRRYHHDDD